jgi:hypothetical protein
MENDGQEKFLCENVYINKITFTLLSGQVFLLDIVVVYLLRTSEKKYSKPPSPSSVIIGFFSAILCPVIRLHWQNTESEKRRMKNIL